jgi:hypothetical protein
MTTTTIFDTADEFIWESITRTYDANGIITNKETTYDNETFIGVNYTDGKKTNVTQLDLSENGSARNWQEITTNYDLQGLITDKVVRYDNDTVRSETYEAGQKTSLTLLDESGDGSAKNWQSITTNFDENGLTADRVINYDNDTLHFENYSNGVKQTVTMIDNSELGNAKNWSEINTTYNEDGSIQHRVTQYDDGRVRVEQYDGVTDVSGNPIDGKVLLFDDTADQFNWESSFAVYDENNSLLYKGIEFDNHDVSLFQYEDGDLRIRLDLDEDESHSWYARERFYDENGELIETIYYDNVDDVPEYYGLGNVGEAITTAV